MPSGTKGGTASGYSAAKAASCSGQSALRTAGFEGQLNMDLENQASVLSSRKPLFEEKEAE
jgi:hypothetical protein